MTAMLKFFFGKGLAVVLVAMSSLVTASAVPAQEVNYTGSLQFTTGNYIFTERTSSLYFYNGVSVTHKAFRFSVSIPVIQQSTPWISYGGAGMIPSGGTQNSDVGGRKGRGRAAIVDTTSFDQVGLGDPLFHADFEVLRESKVFPSIRFMADVKLPVAEVDRGFGTGEWDYSGGLSLAKAVGGSFVFADMAYWILGDLPDLELQNPVAYSIAAGRLFAAGKIGLLASLSGYTRILEDIDPPVQIGLGINYRLDSKRSLNGSAAFGVTESTPDFSISVGWSIAI